MSRTLFWLLGLSSGFGVLLPLTTIVLKDAAAGFPGWIAWGQAHPRLAWLDLHVHFNWLVSLSWHNPKSNIATPYYLRYAIFNAVVFAVLFRYRPLVMRGLGAAADWYFVPSHRRARRIIFGFWVFLVFAYQTKLMPGFWIPGIAGWTYEKMLPQPPLSAEIGEKGDYPSFLDRALLPEHAQYLPYSRVVSGKAMFLHYSDGTTLPANFELTNVVFPNVAFGTLGEPMRRQPFFEAVAATLSHRRNGTYFFLPVGWAYPNHAPYMPIEYAVYPASDLLAQISLWDLKVIARREGKLEILEATQTQIISRGELP